MNKLEKKKNVPPVLKNILTIDIHLTHQFIRTCERFLAFLQLKIHYKALEISCNGLLWISCWIAFVWIFNSKDLYEMQINFFLGLIVDITLVAVIKAIVRRRRPTPDNSILTLGPDKFSFPSGHTSRAFFILYFFLYNWPVSFMYLPPLLCWTTCVSISRILMRRHYLLDVFAGCILGSFVSYFISFIYLEQTTCENLIWWIIEEKLDGDEYHV